MKKVLSCVLKSSSLSLLTSLGILTLAPANVEAQNYPACPESGTTTEAVLQSTYLDGCRSTPDQYTVTFYEVAMCKGDPIAGGSFDSTTCVKVFSETGGKSVDLAGGNSIELDEIPETPIGTYTHFYVILGNTFLIRGSYEIDTGTWYTDGQDPDLAPFGRNAKNTPSAVAFQDFLSTFGANDEPCQSEVNGEEVEGGTLSALLVDTTLNRTCDGAAKIIASFKPNSSITIEEGNELNVAFTVTNNGMFVVPSNPGTPGIQGFGGGPFNPYIRVIK